MGILKNALKNGITNVTNQVSNKVGQSIANGIAGGITNAVGNAVESTVKPAADKAAGEAANALNQTAGAMNQAAATTAEAGASMASAAAGTTAAAPAAGSGFASLAGSFASIAGSMTAFATEAASNIKICPKCGEGATADNKFCPKCGAPLPEETIGSQYVCPKCGKKNVPGTTYCTGCGEVLPAAAAEAAAQKAKDEATLAKWEEILPDFPKWSFGGEDFEFIDNGTQNGYPCTMFRVFCATQEMLDQYVELLKKEGFVRPENYRDDEELYKVVNGVCRTFNQTDALVDNTLNIGFYVSNHNKPKEEKKEESTLDSAKKLFGKIFG